MENKQGFEVLFDALLRMKTDGVCGTVLAQFEGVHCVRKVVFGLLDSLLHHRTHLVIFREHRALFLRAVPAL